jgi:hypothetical protein
MPNYKPSATENILRLIGIHTVHKTRDPLPSDTNYGVPTLWVNDSSQKGFILILDDGSAGTWLDLGETPFPRNFDDFYDASLAPPVASVGDSYILGNQTPVDAGWTAIGATNDEYVEYTGSSWVDYTPQAGQICYSNDLTDFYIYDGSDWIKLSGSISSLTYTSDSRNPNTSDNSYTVPTLWIDTSSDTGYLLTDVTASIATWIKLSNNQLGDAQDSVKSIATSTAPPPTEVNGDRYILDSSGAPNAAWDGALQGDIVEYDGATWVAFTPTEGTFCEVEDEDTVYIFITSWVKLFQYTGASFSTDAGSATPSSGGVLGIVGTAAQGILTAGTGNNVIVTANDATTAQKGVIETATNAEAIAVTATNKALVPGNVSSLLAEPPAIGGTTPSSGAFTDLSATGAFKLYDTDDSHTVNFVWNENDSANRTINYTVNGADRTFALHGNLTVEAASLLNQDLTTDANPSFAGLTLTGTPLNVASGGSGRASHTAYAVLCGGTTGTGAQQSIASVGTANQVLTSNGAGALPTFQTIPAATDVYDNTFRILDDADNTKEIAFEASGITTGTTRTITAPDRDLDLAEPTFDTVIVNNGITNEPMRLVPGHVENLSMTLSGGVITIQGGDGNALSATNPAYVCTLSNVTTGKPVLHTLTSNQTLTDSDMDDNLFGFDTGNAIDEDVTFTIYLAANNSDASPLFFVGREPQLSVLPAAADIGASDDKVADNRKSVFCFSTLTEANYAGNACVRVASFNAQMSASDAWTFTTLSKGIDGILTKTPKKKLEWEFVSYGSGTGATIEFDLPAEYDEFYFKLNSIKPVTNNVALYFRGSINGGSTDVTGYGGYGYTANTTGGLAPSGTTNTSTPWLAVLVGNSYNGVQGEVYLVNCNNNSARFNLKGHTQCANQSGFGYQGLCSMTWIAKTSNDYNWIKFYWSSGNFADGSIELYGRRIIEE